MDGLESLEALFRLFLVHWQKETSETDMEITSTHLLMEPLEDIEHKLDTNLQPWESLLGLQFWVV